MQKVKDVFRKAGVKGDLGIEIEIEGTNLPRLDNGNWRTEADGSLRGESAEYVFSSPKSLLGTRKALLELGGQLEANGSQVEDSGRAGVHVHVNCQELTITQLYNFATLYLILEDLLVEWCGEDRVGNLFCLGAQHAEFTCLSLARAMDIKEWRQVFYTDELRYASMNLKSLGQYGSLEFRAMRSTGDMEAIYKWAKTLLQLRKFAEKAPNPQEFVYQMSFGGEEAFVDHHLPLLAEEVKVKGWKDSLKAGMRRAQDIAFCTVWEDVDKKMRIIGGLEVAEDFEDDFPPIDY